MPASKKKASKKKTKKKDSGVKKGASLVIVESPAKQRTISRMLKGAYVVTSSYGHVRDLPQKKLGVDEDNRYEPSYSLLTRTKKLLPELKKQAKAADFVYLATDHDREGESIAWHLAEILDVDASKIRRITFHEITPQAIKAALGEPREVDMSLVHAQQARRVIDRLVGYKLSPLLWRKIRRGLSAGRVQSVAVRLLVERAKEIQAFESEGYWKVGGTFLKPEAPPQFEARLVQWKGEKVELTHLHKLFAEDYRVKSSIFKNAESADAVRAELDGKEFEIVKVERKEVKRRPTPPFITSTLQQAGSQKLSFAAERTMRVAQSLYEGVDLGGGEPAGLITYMRTDSTTVAEVAQQEAREFLKAQYGDEYLPEKPPSYAGKVKGAQEAHEAIRPTSVQRTPDELRSFLTPEQLKLYTLIWKRFLASQMNEAVYDTVAADIAPSAGASPEGGRDGAPAGSAEPWALFHVSGRTLKFDGFLRVLQDSGEENEEKEPEAEAGQLPDLQEGDAVKLEKLDATEHHTSPPPSYNEASIIRALEKHGIGRPSTYAPTIKTIVDRGYVRRGIKDRRLTPSDLGMLVVEQLNKHFVEQMSLSYTAKVEEQLDQVAEGTQKWQETVDGFFQPFAKALADAQIHMEDSRIEPQETDEECPLCQNKMLIRESRFGKYLSCSRFPKCKGKIQLDQEGKKVVPEATGEICDLCEKPMVIRTGRKGRFLACSGYPACKNTFSLDENGVKIEASRPLLSSRKCNKCSSPMWMRLGKRGHFLACSGFPKCRNLKPLAKDAAVELRAEAEAMLVKEKARRKAEREKAAKTAAEAPGEKPVEAGPDPAERNKETPEES